MSSFEEIIVPLWSITKLRADKEIGERLVKLKDLWKEKHYFSKEIEERFNMHIVEYKQVTTLGAPTSGYKVECVFRMVIWSKFRVGQYRDASHFIKAPHM